MRPTLYQLSELATPPVDDEDRGSKRTVAGARWAGDNEEEGIVTAEVEGAAIKAAAVGGDEDGRVRSSSGCMWFSALMSKPDNVSLSKVFSRGLFACARMVDFRSPDESEFGGGTWEKCRRNPPPEASTRKVVALVPPPFDEERNKHARCFASPPIRLVSSIRCSRSNDEGNDSGNRGERRASLHIATWLRGPISRFCNSVSRKRIYTYQNFPQSQEIAYTHTRTHTI